MEIVDLIRSLAATTSRTEKEKLLTAAFTSGHRQFFIGAQMALDRLITFGIQKAPEILEDDGAAGDFTFEDFLALADKLRRRELTGNAARDALRAAAQRCHVDTWNLFYRRLLLKNLAIGVEAKTVNGVLKKLSKTYPEANKYLIPIFEPQLAHDGNDDAHKSKVKGRKLADVKLDGVRLLLVCDIEEKSVRAFTREGREKTNFAHITDALQAHLLPHLPGSIVLDGEVVFRAFRELMTQLNRKDNPDTSDAKLALFDIIPLDDFKAGLCTKTQRERHAMLVAMEEAGLFQRATDGAVYVNPKLEFDLDTPEGNSAMREFYDQALEAGFEGIMLKDPEAPYRVGRNANWLKFKPKISLDMEVLRVEEGDSDKGFAGTLGALVCRGEYEGKIVESNVASGFARDMRDAIWADPSKVIGQIVEIEADCLTRRIGAENWSLRFPRFVGFRSLDRIPGSKD